MILSVYEERIKRFFAALRMTKKEILGFEMKKASFQSKVAGNYLNDSSKDSKILEEKSPLCRFEQRDRTECSSRKRESNLGDFYPKAESTQNHQRDNVIKE